MRRFIVSRNNWVNKPIVFIEFYFINFYKLKFNKLCAKQGRASRIIEQRNFFSDLAMTLNISYLAFDLESDHDLLNVTSSFFTHVALSSNGELLHGPCFMWLTPLPDWIR